VSAVCLLTENFFKASKSEKNTIFIEAQQNAKISILEPQKVL